MGDTTKYLDLTRIPPRSETHWRAIAARAHRLRGEAGDEAAARTHEHAIQEIRSAAAAGSSRRMRFCPSCLERGLRYVLLFMGGVDRCGTCGWPAKPRKS
ncbi:MAG: hypothetical protein HY293_05770 [Planctomycetes bacterium]|nr:hypothetical protein [Planctomycetota bacterium]